MFLATLTTGHWQANCYLVAAPGRAECVIIDPGQDAAGGVRALLAEHQLTPKALLATHGHFDHIASAAEIADEYNVPLWIHSADRHLLTDPAAGLSADGAAFVKQMLRTPLVEPARVEEFDGITEVTLARLTFSVTHAPGHTGGSVLLGLDYTSPQAQITRIVFTGDVVFAGSIGRTDLPGGDPRVMSRTLSDVVLGLTDTSALLPGHGGQTTMARERVENPYLQSLPARN
ncbi:MAG: MBL fold metallo-hydrolase [Propionicimonas sp.]